MSSLLLKFTTRQLVKLSVLFDHKVLPWRINDPFWKIQHITSDFENSKTKAIYRLLLYSEFQNVPQYNLLQLRAILKGNVFFV
jgi:hypothetical protein